jgi:signal transduction histidine kinase
MAVRVLVVDDEPIVRDVLTRYLSRGGFEVDSAEDGEAALERFTATAPDLVVLDLMLPGVDGVEVFTRIRADHDTPVIMLTARGEETDRVVGLEIGADDYIAKPFSPREVVARVRAVLRRSPVGSGEGRHEGPILFEDGAIDPAARKLTVGGRAVALTVPGPEPRTGVRPAPAPRGALGLRVRRRSRYRHRPHPAAPREDRARPVSPEARGHGVGRRLPVRPVTWRPVALAAAVAAVGAAGTIAVGALAGMEGSELTDLALLLLPAAAVTVVASVLAGPLLRRASFRGRLVAVALVAAVASLANLGALAALMFVDAHDAALMGSLLAYSLGAGVAAGLVASRSQARAVDRLTRTAARLAEGDLDSRIGSLGAGPELDALARTLDEMAERVQRSIAAERTADRVRRDLITAVSHDLRTPLAGLRAVAEAIEDGVVDDPPTLRRYIADLRVQVATLSNLVDDLFELVQLEEEAVLHEPPRARLEDVVGSVVDACRSQAEAKGLVVERSLIGAGSAACSPRIARVLQNLLQNAIRHTPADGTVRIEARRRDGAVEVVVSDTGEGIPADALDRVFDPFWRADPSRSEPGAGLGLALAKRIVEALGGDIRVESAPAAGSRFAVVLPT